MTISVFLVDDHRVLRDGMRILLNSQEDIEVVGEAENGKKAIEGITRVKPDVAVMDITMPELNGIEAAQIIHETLPETGIVILRYTRTWSIFFAPFKLAHRDIC